MANNSLTYPLEDDINVILVGASLLREIATVDTRYESGVKTK